MNFLRKILLIVVISLSAESMGAVFDLPTGTPGLQNGGATLVHPHNGIQCIKVTVNGHDIYFPADGSQPTTPEAVEYSCANIDKYNINSPITEWYMSMFGWIPEDDTANGASHNDPKRIKAGFCKKIHSRSPIFVMPLELVNNDYIFLLNHLSLTKRQSFWYFFRFIASSPVGRVLLYRILIEIGRTKNGSGSVCDGIEANLYDTNARNQNRQN